MVTTVMLLVFLPVLMMLVVLVLLVPDPFWLPPSNYR